MSGKYITIEGQFASQVLGTFRIIRGFAPLQDLAAISAPFLMNPPAVGEPLLGHQRAIDPAHAEAIKTYLENGRPRFIPEIILSVRADFRDVQDAQLKTIGVISDGVEGLSIGRRFKGASNSVHSIKIEKKRLAAIVNTEHRIRRIDGNHRLFLAAELTLDTLSPSKYVAPFCAVLLGQPGDPNDDFVEAMLFQTINSTALPLDSEHALSLVLGQAAEYRSSDAEEFSTNAALHLTRLLKGKLDVMPAPQRKRLGITPATVLNSAATAMISQNESLAADINSMNSFADELSGAIIDILARMSESFPHLCSADFFIELGSLAWAETDATVEYETRINAAVATLEGLGRWLDHDGLHNIQSKRSIASQLFEIFRSVRARLPKRVFLSRWYPVDADGDEKHKADLRLEGIMRTLDDLRDEGIELALDDPGTELGGTFGIHAQMFDALSKNDIILIDLSGVRPNVCIEAGYALRHLEQGRMIFLFQKTEVTAHNPQKWEKPPFDLSTFRYENIVDSGEIPEKLGPHLRAIYEEAKIGN